MENGLHIIEYVFTNTNFITTKGMVRSFPYGYNSRKECYLKAKLWCLNGKPHREDGPAIECADGTKEWYLNGKRHREDGPAVEWADGTKEWWLNDVKLKVRTLAGLKKKVALMICEEIMAA